MSAINKLNVLLNNGETIHIATFQYGTPTFGTSIAKGTNYPPTVINMSRDIILVSKPVVIDYYKNVLINPVTYEEWSSDSYQNDKTYFNNNVRWLWGSVDKGGVYLRKTANDKACIGGITCLAKNENTQEYRYIINESVPYTTHDLSDIVFMYDENSDNPDYPMMYVFTLADMRVYQVEQGSDITYYLKKVYNAFTNLYTTDRCYYINEMTQYITWEGVSGDKPSCYVTGNNISGSFPHNLEYLVAGLPLSFSETIVSGDPWGGQLADDEDDPNNDAGNSQEEGGKGAYPSDTSHQDHPDASSMAVDEANSGFVTLYNPTQAQVKSFNDWLFTDITDALSTQLKRLWANPLDFVLFLAMAHFTPPSDRDTTIQYAGIDSGVIAHRVSKIYHTMDLGSCYIEGDSKTFKDFDPYTKYWIYLPYIGVQPLKADEVTGSTCSLTYNVDMLSGNCIATLKFNRAMRRTGDSILDDVVYHYSGNCYKTIPLTGTDWRGMIQSAFQIMGGIVSMAGGAAGGNPAAIGNGLVQAVDGVISQKVSVTRSGQISGSAGYMDKQKPYIIIERPIDCNPYNYRAFKGYVLNMRYNLGNLKGYTEIESETLWIDGFDGITEEEAEMMKSITSSGFYL